MKLSEINIRDPFILPFDGKYYLYGTPGQYAWNEGHGFWCYTSDNLEDWSQAIKCFEAPQGFWSDTNFWAPEVHYYNGKFYMLASFYAVGHMRATQILASDSPVGPFKVHSCPITPNDRMCLDGTLYVENSVPYMVFCHEWLQIGTGTVCAVRLKTDLSAPDGQPFQLFSADEAKWATPVSADSINGKPAMVTDGPFLLSEDGLLTMFWSSFHDGDYAVGTATSDSGLISGSWHQHEQMLFCKDGGHGMAFRKFDGKLCFTLHSPNKNLQERPVIFGMTRTADGYTIDTHNCTVCKVKTQVSGIR